MEQRCVLVLCLLLVWSWSVAAVIILQSYLSSLNIDLGLGTLFLSSVLLISQGVSNCEPFVWDLARVATSPIWQVLFCNRDSWPKCKNVHMENSRTTDSRFTEFNPCDCRRPEFLECDSYFKGTLSRCSARANLTGFFHRKTIEGFTVADVILVVGQARQNLQWMYGKNRDFDARKLEEGLTFYSFYELQTKNACQKRELIKFENCTLTKKAAYLNSYFSYICL